MKNRLKITKRKKTPTNHAFNKFIPEPPKTISDIYCFERQARVREQFNRYR